LQILTRAAPDGWNSAIILPPTERRIGVQRFITHLLVIAVALWVTAYILPGVDVSSWQALAVASLVLGFLNAIVRPLLVLLTLPITVLTLGLFYLVVNGLVFALAARLVPGFSVASIWWAILGALVVSLISWFIGAFFERD
jgi:putative membrane protein